MMKKLLFTLGAALLFVSPLFAQENTNTMSPFVVGYSSSAVSIYVVGGATTTSATYKVFATSIAFTTAGGLYPGTTHFVFTDANKDTLSEFISYCNAVPATTPGAEGGIRASLVNGAYEGNATEELTVITGATACKGSANAKTLTIDRIFGMSYTMPATGVLHDQQYHITGMNACATYGLGTVDLKIYNGTATTDTELLRYRLNATSTETPILSIPANGELAGSNGTAMRFDIVGSTWVTNSYMSIRGYRK